MTSLKSVEHNLKLARTITGDVKMARKVDDIKVLNIDEQTYAVDAMSETIQGMVEIYNGWNQEHSDAQDRVLQLQAAKNDLSRQIILQVRKEKEEAEKAAEEAGKAAAEEVRAGDPEADAVMAEVEAAGGLPKTEE